MASQGDRDRTILAMVTARAWRDPDFKQRFLSDPASVLADEGVEVPAGAQFKVLEDTDTVKYLNISEDAEQAAPDRIAATVEHLLPIPEGNELRLVQSTDTTKYLVLPLAPSGAPQLGDSQLIALAADSGVQSTYHDTTEAVEAETTEVAVTETTEAQDVETTTTVVAEAELVAT